MGLKDLAFLTAYNKAEHNIAEMFYLPCMRNSVQYDRISGYFGSTIFIIAWDALQEFVENHGTMRIVCSPYVSDGFGTNYSVGSFNDLAPYVLVLYPQTETPYIYVRALINYGLVKIGEIIKEKGMPAIYSLCD